MSTEADIADALLTHVGALPFSPPYPIKYPDVPFVDQPTPTAPPEAPAVWLRATILPVDNEHVGLDRVVDATVHAGILQVDVFHQEGHGEIRPAEIADVIVDHFKYGTRIAAGNLWVSVIAKPSRLALYHDAPWVGVPVRVRFQCIVAGEE